jgi:hypothetical protein
MSETIYYPTATTLVNSNTTVTANATIFLDTTDTGAYLTPSTSNAATIQQWIQRTVNSYASAPGVQPFYSNLYFTSISTGYAAVTQRVVGSVILPDGRIIATTLSGSPAYIISYNPATSSFTSYASSYNNFAGGCLLPDGRALFAPYGAANIGIFNPVTNATSSVAAVIGGYDSACVLPNGTVFMPSSNGSYYGIYNPATNVFTSYPTTFTLTAAGSILIPDGRVVSGPWSAMSYVAVYNYVTNTMTSYSGPVSGIYLGGCYIPDGRIIYPANSMRNEIGIFNTVTNAWSTIATGGTTGYGRTCLLPDGRVLFSSNGTYFGIFNPITNAFSTFTGGGGWASMNLIPDGRVVLLSGDGASIGIVSGSNRPVPREFCLHPINNRS